MKNILVIASLVLRGVFSQSFIYILLISLTLIVGLILALSPELVGGSPFIGSVGLGALLKSLPKLLIQLWRAIVLFYLLSLAASAVAEELKDHAVIPILAHPLSRVQYLLGKWLGIFLLAGSLNIFSELVMDLDRYAMHRLSSFSVSLAIEFVQGHLSLLMSVGVALSLSAIMRARAALICAIIPMFFGGVHYEALLPADSSLLPWLKMFSFMCLPLELNRARNIAAHELIPGQLIVLGENTLYLVLTFLISACLFVRRDLRAE